MTEPKSELLALYMAEKAADNSFIVKENARLKRRDGNRRAQARLAYQLAKRVAAGYAPKPLPSKPRQRKAKRAETMIVQLSDWQCGKQTGSFSTDVLERRIERFCDVMDETLEDKRSAINRAEVFLLGDMIEGAWNYAHQLLQCDSGVYEQALLNAPRIIEYALRRVLRVVPEARVTCVKGNHGRSGPKHDHDDRLNFDSIVYEQVRARMRDQEGRLSIHHNNEHWYELIDIDGKRHLLMHGDRGLSLNAARIDDAFRKWRSSLASFDYLWFGHIHHHRSSSVDGGQWFNNGSPESGGDYALSTMKATLRPSQRLAFHNKHGVISEHQVFLDE